MKFRHALVLIASFLLLVPVAGALASEVHRLPAFAAGGVSEQDSLALVALYDSTGGPGWTNRDNWLTGPVETWNGVTVTDGVVTEVRLKKNNLTGKIPAALKDLTGLTRLYLPENKLTGRIPGELRQVAGLQYLDLERNTLTGPIPAELGNLSELIYLSLGFNQLTGGIPIALTNLKKVRQLYLWRNPLGGEIPKELANMTGLANLLVDYCELTGTIPPELSTLPALAQIWASNNNLTGTVPPELGSLSPLWELNLSHNNLTGTIPPELGNLDKLSALILSYNDLTGVIPSTFGGLTSLFIIRLNDNDLSGSIPSSFTGLTRLAEINFSNNNLTGAIPPEMGDFENLTSLYLMDNDFSGPIPSELWNLTKNYTLRLNNNRLVGPIPQPPALPNMTWIDLSGNLFEDLPDLSVLPGLKDLRVANNYFGFDDLALLLSLPLTTFFYAPQAPFGQEETEALRVGETLELSFTVPGAGNQYAWYRDGTLLQEGENPMLRIEAVAMADAGRYVMKVTNPEVPNLTIESETITVEVADGTDAEEEADGLPAAFGLAQNYPNPFNPTTQIRYALKAAVPVQLTLYNLLGRRVATLVDRVQAAGRYEVVFEANTLPSGLYLYRLQAGDFVETRTMQLVK